jgi:hypothetical protein
VDLAVVAPTERHSELIAHLAAECRRLCKSEMMGIRRMPATDQTSLLGDKFDVIAVTSAARRGQRQYAFIDRGEALAPLTSTRRPAFGLSRGLRFICCCENRQRGLESLLNALGVGCF